MSAHPRAALPTVCSPTARPKFARSTSATASSIGNCVTTRASWLLEKTNIRYLEAESLPQVPHIATIDVSFISLKIVLPRVKMLLQPSHEIIALIKPQFEVGKGKVGKGGVVRSAAEHARVIDEIQAAATELGYDVRGDDRVAAFGTQRE